MASIQQGIVTKGFREDCARLIARFEKLEAVRFQGFSEIWKDMKFPFVFTGLKSLTEQIEFCEDTLTVAKEFFLPPLSFKERVGGLYLLYALYSTMPIDSPKIRVRMEDWQDILEIRAEIEQAEHHDASYILSKLISENAFVYCLLDQELGLEKSYRLKVAGLRNTCSVLSDIKDLAGPNDLFDRLNSLSRYYKSNKASEIGMASRSGEKNKDPRENLNLFDADFGRKVLDDVAQLENSRKFTNLNKIRGTSSRYDVCEKIQVPESRNDSTIKGRGTSDPIRCRLGHGFDTDSSGSEVNEFMNDTSRDNFPDSIFDDSSSE